MYINDVKTTKTRVFSRDRLHPPMHVRYKSTARTVFRAYHYELWITHSSIRNSTDESIIIEHIMQGTICCRNIARYSTSFTTAFNFCDFRLMVPRFVVRCALASL